MSEIEKYRELFNQTLKNIHVDYTEDDLINIINNSESHKEIFTNLILLLDIVKEPSSPKYKDLFLKYKDTLKFIQRINRQAGQEIAEELEKSINECKQK